MREVIGLLGIFPFITWLLMHKKYRDIAAPYNLFTFLYVVNIMLPMLLYMDVSTAMTISNSYIRGSVLSDSTYIMYVILQTVSYYLVIFGTKLRFGKSSIEHLNNNELEMHTTDIMTQKKYRHAGIVLWLIGAIAFLKIMSEVGGIYYFFTHLQYRSSLIRDLDVLSWILPFVNYGVLFIVYSYKGTNNKLSIKIIFLIIISGLMSGLGGRKALLILLIEVLLLYHYCVKKIDIRMFFKAKYVIGIVGIYFFFILMTNFRAEGAFEDFLSNPLAFTKKSNSGLLSTIRTESYVTYYMSIIEYFKTHSLWMGKTFWGLITAIIPSSIFSGKSPIDDGTYLYSICQGRSDIVPPMPFSQLNGSSYPLETFGSMYGNFGMMGLFLGMIILGCIYGWAYRKMKNNSYDLFSVVIYTQIIFTFQLSTLRIFQLFEIIVVFKIITAVVDRQISGGVLDCELVNCITCGTLSVAIIIEEKIKTVHNTLKEKAILSMIGRIMDEYLNYNSLDVGGQLS